MVGGAVRAPLSPSDACFCTSQSPRPYYCYYCQSVDVEAYLHIPLRYTHTITSSIGPHISMLTIHAHLDKYYHWPPKVTQPRRIPDSVRGLTPLIGCKDLSARYHPTIKISPMRLLMGQQLSFAPQIFQALIIDSVRF